MRQGQGETRYDTWPLTGATTHSTMLSFRVYHSGQAAASWPVVGAHVLDRDGRVTSGKVSFADGLVSVQRSGRAAVSLAMVHDAGPAGKIVLRTCQLPPRDEPYVLTVELARHRLMLYLAKCEEWQMFELTGEHPANVLWEQARRIFIQAMVAKTPEAANAAASEVLPIAIEASERLAMAHAEILLHRRYATGGASPAALAVKVWPGRFGKGLASLIKEHFQLIALPMPWASMSPAQGVIDFDATDRWMQWAVDAGMRVLAGPVIDCSADALPEWVRTKATRYEDLRDICYEHLERVVARYRGGVAMWNLMAGVNTNSNLKLTQEQMIDLVRMGCLLVRQYRKGARVMVELVQPWSEQVGTLGQGLSTEVFLEQLNNEGVHLDALGVRLLVGQSTGGMLCRDLMEVSCLLDRFVHQERPIIISPAGAPSSTIDDAGGHWQTPWDERRQAKWLTQMATMALSKPFVESVTWCDLYDYDGMVLPTAGLLTQEGTPRQVFHRLASLRKRLADPLGPLNLPRKPTS